MTHLNILKYPFVLLNEIAVKLPKDLVVLRTVMENTKHMLQHYNVIVASDIS